MKSSIIHLVLNYTMTDGICEPSYLMQDQGTAETMR